MAEEQVERICLAEDGSLKSVVLSYLQVVEKLHVELSSYLGEKFKMRSF